MPTPINSRKRPDLTILSEGSKMISKLLNFGDLVIYESTVYPGCTEEYCVPVLEKGSNLKFNEDFFCGYSPERINPGDKKRKIEDIVKVVSGSSKAASQKINYVYKKSIKAGTFVASSIKVAEAAKVIENSQRDINIAFVNELSKIFDKLNINTYDVLKAAKTKWNFLDFKPGLVGGHCIGIDPYYLAYIARKKNYHPKIILAGRKINNEMSNFVVNKLEKKFSLKINKKLKNVLILGLTFKEECNDYRNSLVLKIIKILKKKKIYYEIFDPFLIQDFVKIKRKLKINIKNKIPKKKYDAVIITVSHNYFKNIGIRKIENMSKHKFVFDLKNIYNNKATITF